MNPAPARLLGYEVEEFLKIPMRELIAPEYRGMFDEYLVRIKATGADKGLLCVLTREWRAEDMGIQQYAAHGGSGLADRARDGA